MTNRVVAVDGLRFYAILSVIAFHFFYKWGEGFHGRGHEVFSALFSDDGILEYGYLGVYLFFVISGYVIYYSLSRSNGILGFFVNRFSRIWPPLAFYTLLTFFYTLYICGELFVQDYRNLIPSLFILDPLVILKITGLESSYVDGVVWSLFVEIRFYVLISIVYFAGAESGFLRRLLMYYSVSIFLFFLGSNQFFEKITMLKYLPYFLSGISMASIDSNKNLKYSWLLLCLSLVLLVFTDATPERGLGAFVVLLFLVMTRSSFQSRFIFNDLFVEFGRSSYGLYLMHQVFGMTVFLQICDLLRVSGDAIKIYCGIYISVIFVAAVFMRKYIEDPLSGSFKKILSKTLG